MSGSLGMKRQRPIYLKQLQRKGLGYCKDTSIIWTCTCKHFLPGQCQTDQMLMYLPTKACHTRFCQAGFNKQIGFVVSTLCVCKWNRCLWNSLKQSLSPPWSGTLVITTSLEGVGVIYNFELMRWLFCCRYVGGEGWGGWDCSPGMSPEAPESLLTLPFRQKLWLGAGHFATPHSRRNVP